MARKPTRAPAKKKQPAAVETSESIEEQTRLFLQSGQKIAVIKSGWADQPRRQQAHQTGKQDSSQLRTPGCRDRALLDIAGLFHDAAAHSRGR